MSNESELLRQCAASGQMEVEEIREHMEAGEMPELSMSMFASKADYDAALALAEQRRKETGA